MEYYIHYECPKCGKDVYDRAANFVEHNGIPVFELDDNSQYQMTCRNMIWRGTDGEIVDDEDHAKASVEEQDQHEYEVCDYSFGTGDIEVYGEDDV